jgi:hypothetical protein
MTGRPDPVEIIMAACDAGLPYDKIDEMLRERIPGITDSEMGAAYVEAGQRMRHQGEALLQLANAIEGVDRRLN